jgi:mRNA interferase MazF
MKYNIVLVPFPFDGFDGVKVRLAICLTDKIGKYSHVVIAFITSRVPDDKSVSDMEAGPSDATGLKVKSFIRLHRLLTIPSHLIQRKLGQLPKAKEKELKEKISRLFGI